MYYASLYSCIKRIPGFSGTQAQAEESQAEVFGENSKFIYRKLLIVMSAEKPVSETKLPAMFPIQDEHFENMYRTPFFWLY